MHHDYMSRYIYHDMLHDDASRLSVTITFTIMFHDRTIWRWWLWRFQRELWSAEGWFRRTCRRWRWQKWRRSWWWRWGGRIKIRWSWRCKICWLTCKNSCNTWLTCNTEEQMEKPPRDHWHNPVQGGGIRLEGIIRHGGVHAQSNTESNAT